MTTAQTCSRFLLLPLVLAGFLSACTTGNFAEGVEVSLVNLRFEEITAFETTATFTIRIQNQTPDALALEGDSAHRIYLNNVYVGSGVSDQVLRVSRLSEGLTTVKVHLRNISMARLIRDIIEAKRVDYRLDSQVYAQSDGRSIRFKVSRAGNLDLKDFEPTKPAAAAPLVQ